MPPGQNVQMDVLNRLSAIDAGVEDAAKTILRKPFLFGNLACSQHQPAHQRAVVFFQCGYAQDVFARDQQDVLRGAWVDVTKRVKLVVAIDARGGYLASGDLAEQTVACHFFSFLSR